MLDRLQCDHRNQGVDAVSRHICVNVRCEYTPEHMAEYSSMYVSSRGSPEHRFDSHLGSAAAELVAAASAVAEPLELVPAQRHLDKERVGAQS